MDTEILKGDLRAMIAADIGHAMSGDVAYGERARLTFIVAAGEHAADLISLLNGGSVTTEMTKREVTGR